MSGINGIAQFPTCIHPDTVVRVVIVGVVEQGTKLVPNAVRVCAIAFDLIDPKSAYDNLGQRVVIGTGRTVNCAVDRLP